MNRRFRSLGLFYSFMIIIGLLISLMCASSGSAKPLYEIYQCRGVIEIDYDCDSLLENPINPLDPPREISIDISHQVTGAYAEHIVQRYLSTNDELFNRVHVRIFEKPEWCTISVLPDFLVTELSTDFSYANTSLYLTLKENAPAYTKDTIKLELWGDPIGNGIIYTPSKIFNITFMSGFKPILNIKTPDGTTKTTNPDATVYFDVEMENYGNAKTTVFCKPLNIPEGWRVEILSNVTLGSARFGDLDPSKTIRVAIHPPVSFGYHEDRETIKLSLIPTYYGNTSIRGEEHIISFIVQSEGYSSPGFEFIFLLFGIIGLIIIKKRFQNRGEVD